MKEQQKGLSKWIHIRVSPIDYNKIYQKFERSTDRKLSEYARRVLLDKPVTVNQRNQSLDDFMAEMMQLRTELSAIGNNFNQVVKTLHQLRELSDIKAWLLLNETSKRILIQKVEEIRLKIYQINDQWLR